MKASEDTYNYSAGNASAPKSVAKNSEPTAPNLKDHKLQHADYGELTGDIHSDFK